MPPICRFQQRPPTRTLFEHYPHPSRGQGFWYAHEFLRAVMWACDNCRQHCPLVTDLRQIYLWPCRQTVNRWRRRRHLEGHFLPYRRTGNARATILRGADALLLAWLMAVFPRISASEINVLFFNANGQIRFMIHRRSTGLRCESVSRKRGHRQLRDRRLCPSTSRSVGITGT